MKINPEKIKKILCIKPRGIGDIVLSTIILENLNNYYINAKIDYLTEEFAVSVVENNPAVNKVISMKHKEFSPFVALRIRKEKYDIIFDLWSNPRSAQITFLSGAKYRVGFSYRGRRYAYNCRTAGGRGHLHSAEHNLELLKAAGVPIISKRVTYYVMDKDYALAKDYIIKNLPSNSNVIGIIPSGGWPSKRCDASKWVEICNTLSNKYNTAILVLWGPGDEKDTEYIKNNLPKKTYFAPSTSVGVMTGFIKYCSLVIANDSGPMHLASAIGIPTIGLFGPTDPKRHGPYNPNSDYIIRDDLFCIICNKLECPYNHECFTELPVSKLLSKIEEIIIKNNLYFPLNEKN